MTFWKLLNKAENHHDLQFHTGRVDDPLPWNPHGDCEPGGIYFTDTKNIFNFLGFGHWLRSVEIPEDAQFCENQGPPPKKWKASSVILGERRNIWDVEVIRELLKAGADIHAREDWALRMAAHNGHLEVVQELLKAGADVHARQDLALRCAAGNGHLAVVQELLEAGADVHAEQDDALQLAAENGHHAVAKLLKQYLRKRSRFVDLMKSIFKGER